MKISRGIPSRLPRRKLPGEWRWALTRPGMARQPVASRTGMPSGAGRWGSTAAIRPSRTRMSARTGASCAADARTSPPRIRRSRMTPSASPTVPPGEADPPLRFAFWTVRPDIVARNLAHHARLAGERVEAMPIEGRYEAALAEARAAGRGPHAFYAQRAEASLWAAEGWI